MFLYRKIFINKPQQNIHGIGLAYNAGSSLSGYGMMPITLPYPSRYRTVAAGYSLVTVAQPRPTESNWHSGGHQAKAALTFSDVRACSETLEDVLCTPVHPSADRLARHDP